MSEEARIKLVAALAYHFHPCDEDEGMKSMLQWWQLTDDQLREAAGYVLFRQSPLRSVTPLITSLLLYPVKETRL